MSTEHRVVADFYAHLWPWIDHARPTRVLLDDGGVSQSAHPDLCFFFVGAAQEFRIEFKILWSKSPDRNQVRPTEKQLATWKQPEVAPHIWVAKVEDAPVGGHPEARKSERAGLIA